MRGAYRDDLEASRRRVGDLEREHAALQTRNAELTALAPSTPVATAVPETSNAALYVIPYTMAAAGLLFYLLFQPFTDFLAIFGCYAVFGSGLYFDRRKRKQRRLNVST